MAIKNRGDSLNNGLYDFGNAIGGVGWELLPGDGEAPEVKDVMMDPAAKNLLIEGAARAGQSPEEYASQNMRGAAEGSKSLQLSDQQANQDSAGMSQDPYFAKAAHRMYQEKAGRQSYDLGRENQMQAWQQRANTMQQYVNAARGQQAAMLQQQEFLTNVSNQQEAARAGLINNLFQTGAVGMGMYAGNRGGPKPPQTPQSNTGGGMVGGRGSGYGETGMDYNYSGNIEGMA